jgi:hypothetical protein
MCTVSWRHYDDGYQLFCNRDESRRRRKALPPILEISGGVRYLAPRDAERGGTWIAVNEHGLTVCLLNGANLREDPPVALPGTRSRGWLVRELVAFSTPDAAAAHLEQASLDEYSPFTIAILAPAQGALLVEWNGWRKHLVRDQAESRMLASSSVDARGARRYRESLFQHHRNHLLEFHSHHGDAPSAYSPCMHRTGAETVSFTQIEVRSGLARLTYSPGAPCRQLPGEHFEMNCRASSLPR